jgi:flagellar biosynthesis/type III secretory pathway M-ring protein FliF/YscJ
MPWWGWLLVAWAVVATVAALWLGATAAIARRRERATRARQYAAEAADRSQRAAS